MPSRKPNHIDRQITARIKQRREAHLRAKRQMIEKVLAALRAEWELRG